MPSDDKDLSSPPSMTSTVIPSTERPSTSEPRNNQPPSATIPEAPNSPGQGESALPEDKTEEAYENQEEDWESDPANARNWSQGRKWTAVAVVSAYTFVSPLASSMIAPGLPEIAIRYHITSEVQLALTLTIFLLSFALSPLVLAPLSEMYGRTWVLHIANIFTTGFNLGCAFAPTVQSLIGLRFLAGISAAAPIAIGGGSIGDLFSERDRASAMAFYTLGPLIGPVIGPIAGGFIAQTIGTKWVFIILGCVCGAASLFGIPTLRETYAPIIRLRRDQKLGRNKDPEAATKKHPHLSAAHTGNKAHFFWVNMTRPIIILFGSLICFMLSLYMAFMYGIYYLMFTTFAEFFSTTYGFSPGIGGLTYVGLGLGFITATFFGAYFADKVYKYLADKNGGKGKPEMRIPALFFGSLFVPVGLFWYGWTAQAKTHWILPIIGSGIFGFGMMTTFLPITLYLVDAFTYAASATAAASVFRSMLGFVFPLFGQQMYDKLGLGGGNSLLAGLAIVLGIPFPIWLYYKGEQMRARNPLTRS